jgi:hypothetical protein
VDAGEFIGLIGKVGRLLGIIVAETGGFAAYSVKSAYHPTMGSSFQAKNAKCDVSPDGSMRNIFQAAEVAWRWAGASRQPIKSLTVEREITMGFSRSGRHVGT